MTTKVAVPQEDLDSLEEARKELYRTFAVRSGVRTLISLTNISSSMWHLANRKYPKIRRIGPLHFYWSFKS